MTGKKEKVVFVATFKDGFKTTCFGKETTFSRLHAETMKDIVEQQYKDATVTIEPAKDWISDDPFSL